jgi:hypothetical protein
MDSLREATTPAQILGITRMALHVKMGGERKFRAESDSDFFVGAIGVRVDELKVLYG